TPADAAARLRRPGGPALRPGRRRTGPQPARHPPPRRPGTRPPTAAPPRSPDSARSAAIATAGDRELVDHPGPGADAAGDRQRAGRLRRPRDRGAERAAGLQHEPAGDPGGGTGTSPADVLGGIDGELEI